MRNTFMDAPEQFSTGTMFIKSKSEGATPTSSSRGNDIEIFEAKICRTPSAWDDAEGDVYQSLHYPEPKTSPNTDVLIDIETKDPMVATRTAFSDIVTPVFPPLKQSYSEGKLGPMLASEGEKVMPKRNPRGDTNAIPENNRNQNTWSDFEEDVHQSFDHMDLETGSKTDVLSHIGNGYPLVTVRNTFIEIMSPVPALKRCQSEGDLDTSLPPLCFKEYITCDTPSVSDDVDRSITDTDALPEAYTPHGIEHEKNPFDGGAFRVPSIVEDIEQFPNYNQAWVCCIVGYPILNVVLLDSVMNDAGSSDEVPHRWCVSARDDSGANDASDELTKRVDHTDSCAGSCTVCYWHTKHNSCRWGDKCKFCHKCTRVHRM